MRQNNKSSGRFEMAPKRIFRICEEQKLSKAQLAFKMNLSKQSMTALSKAVDCTVLRLKQYSEKLNYNFFQEIANELDVEQPFSHSYTEVQKEMEELRNRLAKQEEEINLKNREIETLNRALSLIGGK